MPRIKAKVETYSSLTGERVQIQPETEPKEEPLPVVKITGYDLGEIKDYIERFVAGKETKSPKEKRFRKMFSAFFDDQGKMTLQSKHQTLRSFGLDD